MWLVEVSLPRSVRWLRDSSHLTRREAEAEAKAKRAGQKWRPQAEQRFYRVRRAASGEQ